MTKNTFCLEMDALLQHVNKRLMLFEGLNFEYNFDSELK